MFQTATTTLDWLGIVAFTTTGALVASRKEMDVVGFIVLGTVTGVAGGTLRDVLLDLPVFWVREPAYLVTCALVSILTFLPRMCLNRDTSICCGSTLSAWPCSQ